MRIKIQGRRRLRVLSVLLLYFLCSSVFVYILVITPKQSELVLNGLFNYIISGAALLLALFFIASTIMNAGKEWLADPGELVIDDDRLINTLSYTSIYEIEMSEISSTEIRNYKQQEFLLVHLRNKNEFLAEMNVFVKFLLKRREKRLGSFIVISKDSVEMALHQIKWLIDSRIQ